MTETANTRRARFIEFFDRYPDTVIFDVGGRVHFVSRDYGMICSADDVAAGLCHEDDSGWYENRKGFINEMMDRIAVPQ